MLGELKTLYESGKKLVVKNLPTILTGVGVVGSVGSVVYACAVAPKAVKRIEEAMDNKLKDKEGNYIATPDKYDNKLNPWEYCKAVFPVYWPILVSEGVSITCIIFANKVNANRQAALVAAYALSQKNLSEYKDEVKKMFGEKKSNDLKEKVAKNDMESHPIGNQQIILTGHGDYLMFDCISGRYFRSNQELVRRAVNKINKKLLYETNVPLNDFYEEIGLPTVEVGDLLGWNGKNFGDELEVTFTTQVADNGEPCLVLNYAVVPGYTSEYC